MSIERRNFPRAKDKMPVKLAGGLSAETCDFSEAGLCVQTEKSLPLSALVRASLPDLSLDTEAEVAWCRPSPDGFQAGLRLNKLSPDEVSRIRYRMMETFVAHSTKGIQDSIAGKVLADFFLKDVFAYCQALGEIADGIVRGVHPRDQAYQLFRAATDRITSRAGELCQQVDHKIARERAKACFREIVGPWIYKSEIVKRAFDKPRGYPGDHVLLEAIYDSEIISNHIGYHSERYFIENEYAVAVRNRKERMREMLKEMLRESEARQFEVMNLGCGSCREIYEAASWIGQADKTVHFLCVDQDEEALIFSASRFQNFAPNVRFDFLAKDVLSLSKDREPVPREAFDLVYTIGLADYFPDRILKKFITFCVESLSPGGTCVIAHKDIDRYKPLSPEWFCDWTFYPRNEEKLRNMIQESGVGIPIEISFEREPSQRVMFAKISRG